MIELPEMYEPTFTIPESFAMNIGDKKVGEAIQAIMDCVVVEKTKSYKVLRIQYMHLLPSRRKF